MCPSIFHALFFGNTFLVVMIMIGHVQKYHYLGSFANLPFGIVSS